MSGIVEHADGIKLQRAIEALSRKPQEVHGAVRRFGVSHRKVMRWVERGMAQGVREDAKPGRRRSAEGERNAEGEKTMDNQPQFVYVTYISTTAEKLWRALIDAEMTTKYWQHVNLSDWHPGSRWEHRSAEIDRTLRLVGTVIESSPPRRLVLTWAFPADEAREDKHTRVMFEIEPIGDIVRLTVTHDRLEPDSDMLKGITEGWPKVLSSLKSLLEVGRPLPKLW
jgi:uncharacterized protein YndB with AHSA1/START domain